MGKNLPVLALRDLTHILSLHFFELGIPAIEGWGKISKKSFFSFSPDIDNREKRIMLKRIMVKSRHSLRGSLMIDDGRID